MSAEEPAWRARIRSPHTARYRLAAREMRGAESSASGASRAKSSVNSCQSVARRVTNACLSNTSFVPHGAYIEQPQEARSVLVAHVQALRVDRREHIGQLVLAQCL